MRKKVVGVMGPGEGAREEDVKNAHELGGLIAKAGWILLSGGRNGGVMHAVSQGAQQAGGLVIGVLPSEDGRDMSDAVDIAIFTATGSGRNNVNVLSSDVVIACGMGCGTASEVALALKAGKKVLLLQTGKECEDFFRKMAPALVEVVPTPKRAVEIAADILAG